MRLVSGLDRIERYSGIQSLACLARTLESARPDIVVPCDDGVVAQLHALHAERASLRGVIERSLGDPQSFKVVSNRHDLLATASSLGISVPETRRVKTAEDLVWWHENVAEAGVLKVDGESGGEGVRICASIEESLAGWREFSRHQTVATGWKRLAVDRNPLALWLSKTRGMPDITMQRLVRGRPANCMAACHEGKVLAAVSVEVIAADGPTGAAMIVRRIFDERIERAARRLADTLRLSGFFGLDFMIETDTGTPYLIEMNPRCTQLGHIEFPHQGSIAGAFAAHWGGKGQVGENPVPSDTIALFPQGIKALRSASVSPDGTYLDLPKDEPALVTELELPPWPQRRWAARVYHAFRPIKPTSSIEYEIPNPTARRGLSSPPTTTMSVDENSSKQLVQLPR